MARLNRVIDRGLPAQAVAVGAAFAVAAVTWAVAPGHVRACGPTPCAEVRDQQPRDGAVGVATNAEVRVRYFGSFDARDGETRESCEQEHDRLRLVPVMGDPEAEGIELSTTTHLGDDFVRWVVGRPSEALRPQTAYLVQRRLDPRNNGACSCGERVWTTMSTFITGDGPDTEVPRFVGIARLEALARQTGGVCGTVDIRGLEVELAADAEDDHPDVRYHLYVDGELQAPYVEDFEVAVAIDCGTQALTLLHMLPEQPAITIRAVDAAGNESPALVPVRLPATCDGDDADGSVVVTLDAPQAIVEDSPADPVGDDGDGAEPEDGDGAEPEEPQAQATRQPAGDPPTDVVLMADGAPIAGAGQPAAPTIQREPDGAVSSERPTAEACHVGTVGASPAPRGSLAMLALGCLVLARRRRRPTPRAAAQPRRTAVG